MSDASEAPCCAPGRDSAPAADPERHAPSTRSDPTDGMVRLTDCRFRMGTADPVGYPADGEGPVREVRLADFWIGRDPGTLDIPTPSFVSSRTPPAT